MAELVEGVGLKIHSTLVGAGSNPVVCTFFYFKYIDEYYFLFSLTTVPYLLRSLSFVAVADTS